MALIEDTIIADIIDEYEAARRVPGTSEWDAYKEAARKVGVTAAMVQTHVKALRSTVKLAKMKLLAKSSAMVEKIIEKAPTGELIDILSRPGVGVLEPATKGAQGNGGFILSVAMDSLGGVRATAGLLPADLLPGDTHDSIQDAQPAEDTRRDSDTGGTARSLRDRLARARAASHDAEITGAESEESGGQQRAERREGVRRLQGADEAPRERALALGSKRSKIHLRDKHESFESM